MTLTLMPGLSASNLLDVVLDGVERVVPDDEFERDVLARRPGCATKPRRASAPAARSFLNFMFFLPVLRPPPSGAVPAAASDSIVDIDAAADWTRTIRTTLRPFATILTDTIGMTDAARAIDALGRTERRPRSRRSTATGRCWSCRSARSSSTATTCRSAPTRCSPMRVSLAAAERLARQRRRAAAALVRLFGASHALCRHASRCSAETLMALVEDIVASRGRARLPPHPHRQRPWRQQRRHRRARLDARPQALRQGADRRASPISSWRARRSPSCASREPGGMGHACEFETAMMQHIRPELVAMERAATTYPDPGSRYLTTDLLGGSAVRTYHRFRRPLAERHARRSVARHAREGRAVLRRGGRRARPPSSRISAAGPFRSARSEQGSLKVGVIGLGFFGEPPCPRSMRDHPAAELVAVCDRDPARAARIAGATGAQGFDDLARAAGAARPRCRQHLPAGPAA